MDSEMAEPWSGPLALSSISSLTTRRYDCHWDCPQIDAEM
jgi:hypothetical protein